MATYTTNYQLHQWEASDNFLRTDFNTDFQKLDAALAEVLETAEGRCQVIRGNYTGTGASSRWVHLNIAPRLVVLSTGSSTFSVINDNTTFNGVTISSDAFQVSSGSPNMNQSGKIYHYVALR